jgi:hypothetical protein
MVSPRICWSPKILEILVILSISRLVQSWGVPRKLWEIEERQLRVPKMQKVNIKMENFLQENTCRLSPIHPRTNVCEAQRYHWLLWWQRRSELQQWAGSHKAGRAWWEHSWWWSLS